MEATSSGLNNIDAWINYIKRLRDDINSSEEVNWDNFNQFLTHIADNEFPESTEGYNENLEPLNKELLGFMQEMTEKTIRKSQFSYSTITFVALLERYIKYDSFDKSFLRKLAKDALTCHKAYTKEDMKNEIDKFDTVDKLPHSKTQKLTWADDVEDLYADRPTQNEAIKESRKQDLASQRKVRNKEKKEIKKGKRLKIRSFLYD